jgi:hypothetical protein
MDVLVFGFVAGLAVLAIISSLVRRKERQVTPTEPCRNCGYSMVDAALDICPECGREYDPSDRRPYFGRSRALTRSFAIVLLAFASTIVAGNADLPTYGVLSARMEWTMQSVLADPSSPTMRVVGWSSQHGWASNLDLDTFPPLEWIEFAWRGETLTVVKDTDTGRWVDKAGQVVHARDVLAKLNCTDIPEQQVGSLLTMNWSDGELRAFLETSTFDNPSDYGDIDIATVPHFVRNRYRFHYSGGGANLIEYEVGLYVSWALIWIVAVGLIGLSFWVDRRKPSQKTAGATLSA